MTTKDLAEYLADYIEHELDAKREEYGLDIAVDFLFDNLSDYIQEGIDAFESTEGVKISIYKG